MPFSQPVLPLQDILGSIAKIEIFVGSLDLQGSSEDVKTIAAVERKLQLITGAAVRLGEQAEILCPGIAWRNIRGMGNWLRHQYDRVDLETIWNTISVDLPVLKDADAKALQELQSR